MTTLEEIMFHVETYKKEIITKEDCEQAIGEILNGTVEPPFPVEPDFPQAHKIDQDWYIIGNDGEPVYINR